ncbi:hypothetical protein PAXRUDRAFT_20554 [Paxillus rubicundulus Ve08.2h10]|uniref:Uncharacterized protein n=1 Tax=Paxillus rubicundulus Ve08.2h10 TaxID=930991 RepID=A0A0D0D958_9AGAM|nr:hypothetical protein PAXRUDRAFT_20554 [Paxillus rubicundulus Ve08.2h10]
MPPVLQPMLSSCELLIFGKQLILTHQVQATLRAGKPSGFLPKPQTLRLASFSP